MHVTCQHCKNSRTLKDKRSIRRISNDLYTCPACLKRTSERTSLKALAINWEKTQEVYGHTLESLPNHGKIVVACAKCQEPLTLVYRGPKILADQIGRATHKTCFRHSEEVKTGSIASSQRYWQRPDSRAIASEIIRGRWRDPEYRKSVIDALLTNDKSFVSWDARQHSEFAKSLWQDEAFRTKMTAFLKNEQRQLMIELWADDDYREHMATTAFWKPQPSKLQRRLIPLFDKHGLVWGEEYRIRFYHFDYFLPEVGILIEVQGNYWHSKPEAKYRDQRKKTFVERHTDYRLIEVWEDEFADMNRLDAKIVSLIRPL
jgi:quinol monooxygenase YgiN